VEDRSDIAASETPRRPRGLRRVVVERLGRLYGTLRDRCRDVEGWRLWKASRNAIFQRLRNLYLWRCLGGSVETTQTVYDSGSKAHNGGSSPKLSVQVCMAVASAICGMPGDGALNEDRCAGSRGPRSSGRLRFPHVWRQSLLDRRET